MIFNSIDCVKGMKYHYKKGDWEKDILPCVNKVCKKWGLKELRLEERVDQERYGEHKNKWDDFLRAEIDDPRSKHVSGVFNRTNEKRL